MLASCCLHSSSASESPSSSSALFVLRTICVTIPRLRRHPRRLLRHPCSLRGRRLCICAPIFGLVVTSATTPCHKPVLRRACATSILRHCVRCLHVQSVLPMLRAPSGPVRRRRTAAADRRPAARSQSLAARRSPPLHSHILSCHSLPIFPSAMLPRDRLSLCRRAPPAAPLPLTAARRRFPPAFPPPARLATPCPSGHDALLLTPASPIFAVLCRRVHPICARPHAAQHLLE